MNTQQLPVIDLGDLERPDTLRAIDAACREWGFFQVVDHGIDPRMLAALQRQMREFFAQPLQRKQEIVRSAENPWGFYDRELTRHTPDWKQIYDVGPSDGEAIRPQWPAGLREFKPVVAKYAESCSALALRLLNAIATNLGVPAWYLDADFRNAHTSFLRLNYYPACPAAAAGRQLGVNPHTDSGAVTVLLQDEQPGLEVLHQGQWVLVEPRRDALVVNIGDIVQVWSNDRYRAALHRAFVHAEAERFSAPFFLNPSYNADYAPLPTTIDAANPPRYRPINWGEFRARRTAGDYANAGEYAEISQYQL
jgi:isopenicillin N synthase-like dioxygenase